MSQSWYTKWDLLERKQRLQPEQWSGARKPVAPCSGKGWGFYGCFNSGLGGFFSLAMDLWAFLGKLICFAPYWRGETLLRAFCLLALWQIYQTPYLFFRMQKCRFTTPSQDAGNIVLSRRGSLICLRSPDSTIPNKHSFFSSLESWFYIHSLKILLRKLINK
jgi:hypothetical protein